jgi:hypothetical protein
MVSMSATATFCLQFFFFLIEKRKREKEGKLGNSQMGYGNNLTGFDKQNEVKKSSTLDQLTTIYNNKTGIDY